MQKEIDFFHEKGIDILKLGCILPNLANICLLNSTDYKFYPLFLSDSDLFEKKNGKIWPVVTELLFRKAVANETFIRKSNNLCKSNIDIDASQFYPYSMRQDMPTRMYTRWDDNEETQKFKAGQNRFQRLKIWSSHTFKQSDLKAKWKLIHYRSTQKKFLQCWRLLQPL